MMKHEQFDDNSILEEKMGKLIGPEIRLYTFQELCLIRLGCLCCLKFLTLVEVIDSEINIKQAECHE